MMVVPYGAVVGYESIAEPVSLPVLSGLVILRELEFVMVVVEEVGDEPAQLSCSIVFPIPFPFPFALPC